MYMENTKMEQNNDIYTGKMEYTMKNDFMFKAVFQENRKALEGILCALLGLERSNIESIIITNPIEYGNRVDDKTMMLDIKLILNNEQIINIEMQVANLGNWKERSLTYLCRAFDQLVSGENYKDVKRTVHIGILDFTPNGFPKEFYSEYVFYCKKTNHVYSDKIGMYMLQLRQLGKLKDEKEMPELYHWAELFQATTWEEIKMLADKNEDMKECVVTIKKLTADEKTRQQLEAREKLQRDMMSATELGYQSGLERGLEDGKAQGMVQGIEQGIKQGIKQGIEQGIEQGKAQGMVQGEARVNRLIQMLLVQSRVDEIERAVSDKEYQKKLFEEFDL